MSRAVGVAGIAVGLVTLAAAWARPAIWLYGTDLLIGLATVGLLLTYPAVALVTRRP
jgi:uncharacterized membrane protein YkgB